MVTHNTFMDNWNDKILGVRYNQFGIAVGPPQPKASLVKMARSEDVLSDLILPLDMNPESPRPHGTGYAKYRKNSHMAVADWLDDQWETELVCHVRQTFAKHPANVESKSAPLVGRSWSENLHAPWLKNSKFISATLPYQGSYLKWNAEYPDDQVDSVLKRLRRKAGEPDPETVAIDTHAVAAARQFGSL